MKTKGPVTGRPVAANAIPSMSGHRYNDITLGWQYPLVPRKFNMRITCLTCLLLLVFTSSNALAGLGTITGKEFEGWSTGEYNVVLGVIKEIRPINGKEFGLHRATFVPAATLAGTFDPSLHPTLPISFYATGFGT